MNIEEKLYDINGSLDESRKRLYFLGDCATTKEGGVYISEGGSVDFGTYFNAFSIKKWFRYTTIDRIVIRLRFIGKAEIHCYGLIKNKTVLIRSDKAEDRFEQSFDVKSLCESGVEILAFSVKAVQGDCTIIEAAYYGGFSESCDVKIGITICTFHREKYLLKNLNRLQNVCLKNRAFSVLVIDNGSSITEQECGGWLRVVHNPNYGGAGGFARGLIEQVSEGKNTHVVLMDDDILIETSAFDRLYSLVRHIKPGRLTQMISGAMLDMECPLTQYENSAYWSKVRLYSYGKGLDLSCKENLSLNESYPSKKNQYGAWWFCCIPMQTVKTIGYPLPIFIKGDDMEYGIRNNQEIMTLNGIGVWHETFDKKKNLVVNYFSDRNMLIINHYAIGGSRWTFLIASLGRLARRIFRKDLEGVKMLELAVRDVGRGLEGITEIPADRKLQSVKEYTQTRRSSIVSVIKIILMTACQFIHYEDLNNRYLQFRDAKLSDQEFWRRYLSLN